MTEKQATSNRGEKIAKVGTIVSASVASSCCWLPLLLIAVGVSGAGIASTLEAYRPLLIVKRFAWDTYMIFDADAAWSEMPPAPLEWMHQLGALGEDHPRWLNGDRFRIAIRALLD